MSWRHEIFESVTPVKERNTEKSNCTLNHIPPSRIFYRTLSRIYLHQLNHTRSDVFLFLLPQFKIGRS